MPKKFLPAGGCRHLKASTLKVNKFLYIYVGTAVVVP
jgi:hypothetical protein